MDKSLLFLAILFSLTAQGAVSECRDDEILIYQEFVQSPWGSAARTIDANEADQLIQLVTKKKNDHADKELKRIQVVVCTSDWPLPSSKTNPKREGEHLDLAKERSFLIKKSLAKLSYPSEVSFRVCGPKRQILESHKNMRWVVKDFTAEPIYDAAYKQILKIEGIEELYKNEALIESSQIKVLYPKPFEALTLPFHGYQVKLFGKEICKKDKKEITSPSGKNQ